MASYTDGFTGTNGTSPPTGWGGTEGTSWSIQSNKLNRAADPTKVLVYQSACDTDNTVASIGWETVGNAAYYHQLGVRCPDNDETSANYDCYLAEWGEGGSWAVYRIVNGAVSATLASGSGVDWAVVGGGQQIQAVNSAGNPIIDCTMGGTARLTAYTDSNAAKITTGKYALVLNFGVSNGDNFTFADVATPSGVVARARRLARVLLRG